MDYAYFPGCSLESTGIEFHMSTKAVAKELGINLIEIPDWNCCGASTAHARGHWISLALPARNMAIAEESGLDVAIPCAACYARCKKAEVEAAKSAETREKIKEIIGRPYEGKSKARNLTDILYNDLGPKAIAEKMVKPLKGLKVLTYYGCLMVRPPELACDDIEDPISLDEIMKALGAEIIPWGFKTECCGGCLTACSPEVGLDMVKKIMDAAKKSGADCIVTACPMCHSNLDMRQDQLAKKVGAYDMPVYFITEMIGLSMGMDPKELGIDRHFVPADAPLKKLAEIEKEANKEGGEA
ncbi:MAG: CoB--CoM heterodisulfide reductase iron-sulfur subunit B family protein [Firmicutes bacterium]|nr:CoB--CoM heterodisulfide reductase iron-sulfur subunit B family protein [Bacillota bacterium]